MRPVCLQHVPFEGPGAFAALLANQGVTLERYLVLGEGLRQELGGVLIVRSG
jgi:hypothetical protein